MVGLIMKKHREENSCSVIGSVTVNGFLTAVGRLRAQANA